MTIKRFLFSLPLVFACWIAIMAAVMRMSDAAPAAVVMFPSQRLLAALPEDAGILNISKTVLIVANRPKMTAALYEAGAFLVLPAGLKGCLPLTKERRAMLAS